MAAALRQPLTLLVWGLMALIYLPLAPAAWQLLVPALNPQRWRLLLDDTQLWQALAATLVSGGLAVVGAMSLTLAAIAALWPGAPWRRLASRLPWLLAVPHVAFASAVLLMFAEGGWLWRHLSWWTPGPDRYAIGLGLTLAVKESAFLLWVSYGLLGDPRLRQQHLVLQSLGYGRWQCLWTLLLPALAPGLGIALLATSAWSFSVVDVALMLGPGNPPTLAVLAWQWLNQGDMQQQDKGMLACLLLTLLPLLLAAITRMLWRQWRRRVPDFRGQRRPARHFPTGKATALLLPLCGVLCLAFLLTVAQSSPPGRDSLLNSLLLALAASLGALAIIVLWLEWGPQKNHRWVWLPLLLPALPLAASQYRLALELWFDGEWLAVLWGHLLWVIPWMLFVIRPAWQRLDPRLALVARTLGWHRGRILLMIKCPQLLRPLLTALAVGFSVSIAQYLPTQWLGAGRVATLTTEAVALSSGGIPAVLASRALWQLALPALFFLLAALLARLAGHYRRELR